MTKLPSFEKHRQPDPAGILRRALRRVFRSNRVGSSNRPYWFEIRLSEDSSSRESSDRWHAPRRCERERATFTARSRSLLLFQCALSIAICLLSIGCSDTISPEEEITITKGRVFEQTCAVCHGQNGEGNRDLGAPSIAGMPVWHTKLQIDKYQKGFRGTHPEDLHGQQMRAIALMLDDESIAEAAEKAAALPRIPTTSTLPNPPDTTKARKMFADKCMICHRWNGSGEVAFRSSPLWGLQDWYHAAQLKKYRDGWRGAHSDDFDGPKMAVIASRLSDDEIHAMAAYLAELAHGDDPREVMER